MRIVSLLYTAGYRKLAEGKFDILCASDSFRLPRAGIFEFTFFFQAFLEPHEAVEYHEFESVFFDPDKNPVLGSGPRARKGALGMRAGDTLHTEVWSVSALIASEGIYLTGVGYDGSPLASAPILFELGPASASR